MKLNKPKFWDNKKLNFLAILLLPLTLPIIINNFILKIKKKKKSNKVKSICVGNIYIGGTGKTPLTIQLYKIFHKLNYKVSTAKKFYKNHLDEQTILKNKTNLIIAQSRKEALQNSENRGDNLIIFDDGLQEKNIDYDLKFVCFNTKNWIGNGCLIPAGPLREKLNSLEKYDAIFLNGNNQNSNEIKKTINIINPKIEIFEANYKPTNLDKIDLSSEYLVFSGIGNSDSFKETLLQNNIDVIKEMIFPDHYIYNKNDIAKIITEAKKINAKIITTEKDYVKINSDDKEKINFLEIELEIKKKDILLNFIKNKL
tara:strand:- start:2738 stop:3676 length:939 start_codon:yes stop_codon:yes gene_type:complete